MELLLDVLERKCNRAVKRFSLRGVCSMETVDALEALRNRETL